MLRRTLAAVALLSACGTPPVPIEPTINPKPPVTSAPARPTEAPPRMPAIANRHDAAGAANFVVYWVDTSNHAAKTGKADQLRAISTSNCEGCTRYIDLYEKTYAAGGYFRGGDRTLTNISVDETDQYYVTTTLVAAPGRYRESKDSRERKSGQERTRVTFSLTRDRDSWKVAEVGLAAP